MNVCGRMAIFAAGLALAGAAVAHTMLDRAAPRVGSSVKAVAGRVELWFTEPLEPTFSTVKVLDASGRRVDRNDAAVDQADSKHLFVSVSALPPGRYRVLWRVVSADTHATEGDFTFDVAP